MGTDVFEAFGGYRGYLRMMVPNLGVEAVAEALGSTPDRIARDCQRYGVATGRKARRDKRGARKEADIGDE